MIPVCVEVLRNIKNVVENKMKKTIEEIHESFQNGQKRQGVKWIDEYDVYDFWNDYHKFLEDSFSSKYSNECFVDVTVSYFRIKAR
jgi:hypothetical protein